MLGDKYILEPEAILDHSVLEGGKRMYLVKWKPKWVKTDELPPGVYDKWQSKKAKRPKMDPQNPAPEDLEEEEGEQGFRILKERQLQPGEEPEDDDDDEEEDDDDDDDDDEEEGEEEEGEDDENEFDEDIDIKEEEDDEEEEEKFVDTLENGTQDLNTLSSIDRDIVLNELPGETDVKMEDDIKKEEEP